MSSDRRSPFMSRFSLFSHLILGLPLLLEPSTIRAFTLQTDPVYGLFMTCLRSNSVLKAPFGIIKFSKSIFYFNFEIW